MEVSQIHPSNIEYAYESKGEKAKSSKERWGVHVVVERRGG